MSDARRRKYVIVAENIEHAGNCARMEMKWRRIGPAMWADDAGNQVQYIDDIRRLHSYDRGTVVYLGWGWRSKWTPHLPFFHSRGFITDEVTA